jgi:hypothetical protein
MKDEELTEQSRQSLIVIRASEVPKPLIVATRLPSRECLIGQGVEVLGRDIEREALQQFACEL